MSSADGALLEAPEGSAILAGVAARLDISAPLTGRTEIIPLDLIDVPDEELVRRDMRGGAPSFELVAMLHSPSVVRSENDRYTVMAGARRVLSARDDGQTEIECKVFEDLSSDQMALITLVENGNRAPAWIRELRALCELVNGRVGMDEKELARILRRPISSIREMLRLTRLPEPILALIFAGKVNKNVTKRLPRLTVTQLDRLAEVAAGGDKLTDEMVSESLRTQYGAISAPLADILDMPDLDSAEEPEEERSEKVIDLRSARGEFDIALQSLRWLAQDAPITVRAQMLAKTLLSELEAR